VEEPGVIYLTMADLFQLMEDRKDENNFEVTVTFLEIYNEEIRDLLSEPGTPTPRGGLQIREDKSVKVSGLTELRPTSADEVKEIVLLGNTRRTQSPTNANETSSRSHAVLQVHVTQAPRTASLTEERTMATLSIIDLAGSERAAATTNMGQRMVEGANINKSLLALGNCINSLCESGGAMRHVPYRNSKLTRLLKFSLGGNCKTVMIVCVAPTSQHFDDTHNTLIYAERATKIKTKVVTRNVVNVDRHVGQYVEAINRLNQEVAELKGKLAGKKRKEEEIERRKKAEAIAEVEKAKSDLHVKAEQARPLILDGATCTGKLLVAQAKRDVIRARLNQIDTQASSSQGLSSDLEVERKLLLSLLEPEEQILNPASALSARVQRSTNSSNMFDATLRAVVERRSDKLDEVCVENVKLDARWRKAEMEKLKAEGQRDAVTQVALEQEKMIVNLVGLMGKCAVTLSEASQLLRTSIEDGRDGLDETVKAVIATLNHVTDGHDEAVKRLIGQSGSAYATDVGRPSDVFSHSSAKPSSHRSSSIGVVSSLKAKTGRRSVSASGVGTPGRKTYRNSPRKSRTSITSIPFRRLSDKDKKKVVQWKDQAGKGDLVEAGSDSCSISLDSPVDAGNSSNLPRSSSRAGSESEWEDEKTDDSVNVSLAPPPRNILSTNNNGKRSRSSRLDPNFLKFKGSLTLASLAEDDAENDARVVNNSRRISPLSDRNMNTASSDTSSASVGMAPSILHIPKGRDRQYSPMKRAPPTPRTVGGSRSGRRRSNIGPMRSEKARRRSSLIPQLSSLDGNGLGGGGTGSAGPRRVPMTSGDMSLRRSPGRKPKRLSLFTTTRSASSTKPLSFVDANVSIADISFRGSKPTWK
jgi:kinesin family member 18/19